MISIIIPVYNAEKYLRQCIESIMKQNTAPMEVIILDDGSTDSSLKICREYATIDERITVIEKQNSGVSDTRNQGIRRAKGEYILFVDADDYLVPDALEKISSALESHSAPDLLVWGFSSIGERQVFNDTDLLKNHQEDFTSHELLQHLLCIDPQQRFRGLVWRCAFRTALLRDNGITFCTDLKMAEDYKFMADAILKASRISVLPEELYVYRVNNDSVTARFKANVHGDMLWVNRRLEEDLCCKYPDLRPGLDCSCAETYIVAMQNCCNDGTPYGLLARIRYVRDIRKQFGYSEKIRSACRQWRNISRRQRLVYTMLRLHLDPLYVFLYSIKRKTLCAGGKP